MSNGYTLWAWQCQQEDGVWGSVLASVLYSMPPTVLVTRDKEVALTWKPLAEVHHRRTGEPVRLAEFVYAGTLEEVRHAQAD